MDECYRDGEPATTRQPGGTWQASPPIASEPKCLWMLPLMLLALVLLLLLLVLLIALLVLLLLRLLLRLLLLALLAC